MQSKSWPLPTDEAEAAPAPTRTVAGVVFHHIGQGVYRSENEHHDIRTGTEMDADELTLTPAQAPWLLYGYATARWCDVPSTIFLELRALGCIHPTRLAVTKLGRYWCDRNHLETQMPVVAN